MSCNTFLKLNKLVFFHNSVKSTYVLVKLGFRSLEGRTVSDALCTPPGWRPTWQGTRRDDQADGEDVDCEEGANPERRADGTVQEVEGNEQPKRYERN